MFVEMDNQVRLPVKTHIRIIIISADVIHSWSVIFPINSTKRPGYVK